MNALLPYVSRHRAPLITRRTPSLLDLLHQRTVTLRPLARPSPRRRASMLALTLALDRSQRSIDDFGFMHVHRTILSEARIDPYRAEEIPNWQELGLTPGRQYQMLRDPDAMRQAVPTMNALPVLVGHCPVSASDLPHELVVGCTGTDAEFDGRYLWNSLSIWSLPAIRGVENNEIADISMAYSYVPVMQEGIWNGRHHDGVMTQLAGNHCSLVDAGRVPSARVAA